MRELTIVKGRKQGSEQSPLFSKSQMPKMKSSMSQNAQYKRSKMIKNNIAYVQRYSNAYLVCWSVSVGSFQIYRGLEKPRL